MESQEVFTAFSKAGKLLLPETKVDFSKIPWSKHPKFEGVELKHLLTSEHTKGQFSYHLVKIASNKSIGNHTHEGQLETHEIIAGKGTCMNKGVWLDYEPGVISIFSMNSPHEVHAGDEGLYLFAKFIPALV